MFLVFSFIALCLLGIADAGYLAYKHRRKEVLICPLNYDCNAVTESKWGSVFGIRNEVLGLLFYVAAIAAILAALFVPGWTPTIYLLLVLASGGGLVYSIFLIFIQTFVLKNYCFYCLISAAVNLLLFINSVLLFYPVRGLF